MAVADLALARALDAARPAAPAAVRWARTYFICLSAIGVAAFVLGVENRFSSDGLFYLPPQVDFLPPLSAQRWFAAFAAHQQDPVFAACGGTELLAQFKLLYWWEWLRRASVLALAAAAAGGIIGAALMPRLRFVLARLAALCGLLALYWLARSAVAFASATIEAMAQFNVGQYQKAIDVSFASVALALVLAAVVVPPRPFAAHRMSSAAWIWAGTVVLDIAFGALFAAKGAAAFWPTWPLYEGRALPPLAALVSYSPLWLNLTVNHYTIQLVHRTLSIGLWLAALAVMAAARHDAARRNGAAIMFALLTLEMASGIFTLLLGVPPALSVIHQIGGAVVLAGTFVAFSDVSPLVPAKAHRR